jgi:hypothetical protein
MPERSQKFKIDEVQWHNDLALLRSMNGQVPWNERFGDGQMKVLQFNPETQAATYLLQWPADYDPLGEHAHGGNATELVLQGTLLDGEQEWGPGSFFSTPAGQAHGPFRAGPDGCVFLVHTDGPLLDEAFTQALLSHGKAARFRV